MPTDKPLPSALEKDGAHLYYGDIHVATLHADLELQADPESLKKFIRRYERKLARGMKNNSKSTPRLARVKRNGP